jgi:NDP-sugar pyrophosphorylase family protein
MNTKLDTAVVLAGGAGTRLKPITGSIPKGMIEICGKPLLEWIVDWLVDNGVRNIVFGVAYRKNKIIDYFGDGSRFNANIKYSVHTVEGGTCEGFRLAIERHVNRENFFAMNGDQISDLCLADLSSFHLQNRSIVTVVVNNPRCPYGHVITNDDNEVVDFIEKPPCSYAWCNSGNYVFNKKILDYLPLKGDIEKSTFPLLARERQLKCYPFKGFFVTINTYKDLIEAREMLIRRRANRNAHIYNDL